MIFYIIYIVFAIILFGFGYILMFRYEKIYLGGIIGIAGGLMLCFVHLVNPTKKEHVFKAEYELEIINQDSVRIRSLSTGKVYTERFDKVHNALLKDNL